MTRFLHTADWQIGMKAAGLGEAGQRVREARLQAISRLIEIANQRAIGLMLVTGDVFEDNGVDRTLVRRVAELLAGFEGQTFIIPGNHDPFVPGSVWHHPVWNEHDRTSVLTESTPVELTDCTLFPCPLTAKYSTRNPVDPIDAHECHNVAIGLAHGNILGLPDPDPEYPIPTDAPERTGLDFIAVGHWHSTATWKTPDGATRLAYSGTHETTTFGERDSGNALIVEIDGRGAAPKLETIRTGILDWHTFDESIGAPGEIQAVISKLAAIENPANALVRTRLSGLLFAADREALESLDEILQSRFLFGRLDATNLKPAPDDDGWIESLPFGPVKDAAEAIRSEAQSSSDPRQRNIATQALLELFRLS